LENKNTKNVQFFLFFLFLKVYFHHHLLSLVSGFVNWILKMFKLKVIFC